MFFKLSPVFFSFLVMSITVNTVDANEVNTEVVEPQIFTVQFEHKASVTGGKEAGRLHQYFFADKPNYYMDVNSVFCGENVCKLDRIRMYWDSFGIYQKLELGDGVQLEKVEAGKVVDFSQADYQKLDRILSDLNSDLAQFEKHELVTFSSESNALDGFSGATTYIHNDDNIQGAIWTCYTLWHYANGPIRQLIQNYSISHFSTSELVNLLQKTKLSKNNFSVETVKVGFAISALQQKKVKDHKTLNQLLQLANSANAVTSKHLIQFFMNTPIEVQQQALIRLIGSQNTNIINGVLQVIKANVQHYPAEFFKQLAEKCAELTNYPQIHQLLTLLSQIRQFRTDLPEQFDRAIFALLEHETFMVARAAYWYLDAQAVYKNTSQIASFYQKNSTRL